MNGFMNCLILNRQIDFSISKVFDFTGMAKVLGYAIAECISDVIACLW